MTENYKTGDLIVGSVTANGPLHVWRVTANPLMVKNLEDYDARWLSTMHNVQRATLPTMADLIPEPKKRFVKAEVDSSLGDKNFHIFDHETKLYLSFATEATRNIVVDALNQGAEPTFHVWKDRPEVNNGREFRVVITPNKVAPPVIENYVRYVESLVDSNDENFHIYDTVTGKYATYTRRAPRDSSVRKLNDNTLPHDYLTWRDTPNTNIVKPDHTELLASAQMMIEAYDLVDPKSSTAALLRRLKNALARG
jgi:hypothetical protein